MGLALIVSCYCGVVTDKRKFSNLLLLVFLSSVVGLFLLTTLSSPENNMIYLAMIFLNIGN